MKRIAVIISQVEESCQAHIRAGIVAAAEEKNVALTTFTAFSLDSDDQVKSHYTMFQSFINPDHFDGVILFTGAMSEYTPWPVVKRYAESIKIPLVTISGSTGCGANIVINNRTGITEQVNHLVEVHRRRRIAFIGGPESNEEAAERFDAYQEALAMNNIAFDESLVQPGDFCEESGRDGIRNLIEANTFFDAVICVDDYTAIGAIRELQAQGFHVPHDVSVVGFDDIPEAAMITPAITTIQQPFFLLGTTAVETILSMTDASDRSIRETVVLNTHGIYRASCGCTSEEVRMFRENWHAERASQGKESMNLFLFQIEPLIAHYLIDLRIPAAKLNAYHQFIINKTKRLWNAFFFEVESHETTRTLLETLNGIIDGNSAFCEDITIWQCILSNLTPFTFHFGTRDQQLLAGAILHEARIALDSREKHTIQMRSYDKSSRNESIRESCTKIIISGSQEELVQTLSDELIEQGFENAALVLFNHYAPTPWHEWHLSPQLFVQSVISDGEQKLFTSHEEQQFSSNNFIPPCIAESFREKNLIFMPLYMSNEYYGYLLFEQIPGAPEELYPELQIHASSAYKSCFMLDNLRALSMNDELTGLSNRRGFMLLTHQLHARSLSSGTDLLFFYFDLDNLKKINDNFSHEDGDKAIKAAASLLKRTFRNHDIIGRLGGDEFVAVIEESVPGLERIMIKRLYDLIATYNQHSGFPYQIDMSVGTATLQINSNVSVEDTLREADKAMFLHKKERKKGREN